eukprot:TRINITY_DN123351_c0_g1_i1.p1 TRINITY_DN123351_c0_g1~~TRINITY_DN123351_c0_g1_i1.p1  ORF type:complete len:177 (+),score=44.75 TRINITY_DN123351_c0_g1_i1:68-598(+)
MYSYRSLQQYRPAAPGGVMGSGSGSIVNAMWSQIQFQNSMLQHQTAMQSYMMRNMAWSAYQQGVTAAARPAGPAGQVDPTQAQDPAVAGATASSAQLRAKAPAQAKAAKAAKAKPKAKKGKGGGRRRTSSATDPAAPVESPAAELLRRAAERGDLTEAPRTRRRLSQKTTVGVDID